MNQRIRIQKHKLIILIFISSFIYGSINHLNGQASVTSTIPIQIYQVASPLTVYQSDQLNVSLSITNTYFQDLVNVSLSANIPPEVKFLFSSIPDLDSSLENDSEEYDYSFGSLPVNGIILFSVTYNISSDQTKSIELPSMNVSFELQNGIKGFQLSNGVTIFLKGKREVIIVTTLPPIPRGNKQAPPILVIAGYIFPIVIFGLSAFIMRRVAK